MFIPSLIKEFQEAKTYHYDLSDAPIITAFDLGDKIKLADNLFYFCSATSIFKQGVTCHFKRHSNKNKLEGSRLLIYVFVQLSGNSALPSVFKARKQDALSVILETGIHGNCLNKTYHSSCV